jgi:hypothetical protein
MIATVAIRLAPEDREDSGSRSVESHGFRHSHPQCWFAASVRVGYDKIIFFLLPNDLQDELNLPWVRGCRSQQTGSWINRASRIEDVVIAIS